MFSQIESRSVIAFFGLLAALPAVHGHAAITSPPIRGPGANLVKTCGQASFDSIKGDPTGHIEEQTPFNTGCEPTLCRGMSFSDQPASNVQKVKPGQAMSMGVDCTIPHGGPANVSLIDTTGGGAGQFIGSFLKTFDDFCPTSGVTPADQSNLQFTLPESDVIGNKCTNAGDCVVQLFWATPDFSQNYYYCVDVQIPSAAVAAAPVAVTSSTPVTSVASVATSAAVTSSSSAPVSVSTPEATTSSVESVAATTSSAPVTSSLPVTTSVAAPVTSSLPVTTTVPAVTSSSTPVTIAPTTSAPTVVASTDAAAPLVMVTITSFAPMPSIAASNSGTNSTIPSEALGSAAGRRVAVPGVFALLRMFALV